MKRIQTLLVVLGVFALPLVTSAQVNTWRWQNPLPLGNYLRAVQMISSQTIVACGDNGSMTKTTDGGATWDSKSKIAGVKYIFLSVSFLNPNFGMLCGDSGTVVRTSDGGVTWKLLTNAFVKVGNEKLNSILVVDANIAIAVGKRGSILRTTDAGDHWTIVAVENAGALQNIRMLRPNFITITGANGIFLKSVDSGTSWTQITLPFANTIFSGFFINDSTATLAGDNGIIFHTTNGGASWTRQKLDSIILTAYLNSVDAKDPNIISIVGDYGTMLYSTDAGTHWKASDIGSRVSVKGLSFWDALNATAVGPNGTILRTTDGGKSWSYLPQKPMTDVLRGIAFAKGDTSIGIAVGNYGTILRTTNGGANWVSVVTNGDRTLNGVAFADPVTAYAVGVVGTILKTTDAGVTWSAMNSGTTNMLNSVSFADISNGVAVGEKGIILQTQTGGVFWGKRSVIPAQDNEFFRSVSFCDRRHAFISAWMGQYATTDGGENWHILPGASDSIESPVGQGISFADSLHGGYVWGDKYNNGYVQHTTDGGKTYHLIYPTGSKTHILRGIQYSDTNRVTVVGDGGYIAHSTDGGKTWTEQESNTLNNLLAVSFGSVQAGTAVGNRGNIVRITTNEKPLPTQSVQSAAESPKIVLDQNYPNPFNGFTTIHYILPRPGYTLIEFFTIEGNRIRQFENGYEPSGDHSVRFDASDLASGVYLCRISNGGMSAEMNVQLVR